MRLLAVETSTLTGAVALLEAGTVVAESRVSVAVTHGERLMAAIDGVLRAARWQLGDVEAFAVAVGPGSFTGLRIGLSTVKGLAFATGKPVVGVPTLDALAWTLPFCAYPVCPDPRRAEGRGVRGALSARCEGRLELLEPARAVAPATLAEELRDRTGGAARVPGRWRRRPSRAVLTEILGTRARLAPAALRLPSAATVGELGGRRWPAGRRRTRPGSSRSICAPRRRSSRVSDGKRAGRPD